MTGPAHAGGAVPSADVLGASPGDRARAAADTLGDLALVRWCAHLLSGAAVWGDSADPDPAWVGGRQARAWGAPEGLADEHRHWPRVWAARTLLYVWDELAIPAVSAGLRDPAWRVREMCAKVCVRWEVPEVTDTCAELLDDEHARVRVAVLRVLAVVGEHEHAVGVHEALDDDDPSVRTAAERAWRQLERRLDRPLFG